MDKNEQKTMKNGRKWTKMDEKQAKMNKNGQKRLKLEKLKTNR
jgi:hypothetical protein